MIDMPAGTTIVSAVQMEPVLLDVEQNMLVAQQMAFDAAQRGARIVVLPELCMSGVVLRSLDEASIVAQESDGYQTQSMVEVARAAGCYIVFGYVELSGGKFYNSAAIVGPLGLLGNVRKHNLYGSDHEWATAADDLHVIVPTQYGRLGALVCRDVINKYRQSYKFNHGQSFYNKGSVDIVALVTSWGSDFGFPDSSWVELVEEIDTNLIVSNRTGSERDMTFKGGSCVIDRTRKVWTNGSSFTEPAIVGGVIIV